MDWDKREHVYLASADNYLGFQLFFEKHKVRQCEHYYTVVGGLGGLNLLPHLNELKSITFFDDVPFVITVRNIKGSSLVMKRI